MGTIELRLFIFSLVFPVAGVANWRREMFYAAWPSSCWRMYARNDCQSIKRIPVFAPRWRKTNDRTGGLLPFCRQGKMSMFKADRLKPVYGQSVPGLGRRVNSGTIGAVTTRGGISTAPLASKFSFITNAPL